MLLRNTFPITLPYVLRNIPVRSQKLQALGRKEIQSMQFTSLRLSTFHSTIVQLRLFSSKAKGISSTLKPGTVPISFGVSCSQGKLKNNEDRYDSATLSHGLSYFAVFDGHRGNLSSEFLKQKLGVVLSHAFMQKEDLSTTGQTLIRNAFDVCEESLENKIQASDLDPNIKEHNGSTALAVIASSELGLLLAQTGDSRAVLCRSGEAVCLTTDHTPNSDTETNRIEENGGWIDWDTKLVPYVNGILSMTRSFGNRQLRNAGITHIPFVTHINLDKDNDEFLVLCTDGVSDWMTDGEIVSIVSQFANPSESAHELTCCARQYGSTDDATAFVIPLSAWRRRVAYYREEGANFLRSTVLKRD